MANIKKIKANNTEYDIATNWGKIGGSIADQEDLAQALSITYEADKKMVVLTHGDEEITGKPAEWGQISGNMADQPDLAGALEGKAESTDIKNSTITIKQGAVTKGVFTLNQDEDQVIEVDPAGGLSEKVVKDIIVTEVPSTEDYTETALDDVKSKRTSTSVTTYGTFWLTDRNDFYEEITGKKIKSITIDMAESAKPITFVGCNKDPFSATATTGGNTWATDADSNEFPIFRINTPTVGISTYLLDGTDDRVEILDEEAVNSFPKSFGIHPVNASAEAKFKYAPNGSTTVQFPFVFKGMGDSSTNTQGLWLNVTVEVPSTKEGRVVQYSDDTTKSFDELIDHKLGTANVKAGTGVTIDVEGNDITINSTAVGKPLAGKKFSILADSISTFQGWIPSGYAVYYPRYNVQSVEDTWWKKLANNTGMLIAPPGTSTNSGTNCAWSGSKVTGNSSSTTSASAGCSTKRIQDLATNGTPDIIITLIGINDFGNGVTIGDYTARGALPADSTNVATTSAAYAIMIKKLVTTYPDAAIYVCSPLECYNSSYNSNAGFPCAHGSVYLADLCDNLETLCNAMGARYVNLRACGINCMTQGTKYFGDGLHPNPDGHTLMAQYLKGVLYQDFTK